MDSNDRVLIPGENFLHTHPKTERTVDLLPDYVIVKRSDVERVIEFFNTNPHLIKELK